MNAWRRFTQVIPTLTLSFALAIAVWVSAITEADPSREEVYQRPVPIEMVGQDPGLVMVGEITQQVSVVINAPSSTWRRLNSEQSLVVAMADLSGLGPGKHSVPVQVDLLVTPGEVMDWSPRNVTITLENLMARTLNVRLVRLGEPAIGFQLEEPELSVTSATVSGPESLVSQVQEVRATLEINNAHDNVSASLVLQALDENEEEVNGVSISPERVHISQPITQIGGFRSDLVVKPVYQGSLASGYRLTNISVFPPAVTVFSSDPNLVNNLPGFIETMPINLQGATDDLEIPVTLNLPEGVTLVTEQDVVVLVGVAAIESSQTLANQPIEYIGLEPGLQPVFAPETVDLILSGPLPALDRLQPGDVRVVVDLTGLSVGTYPVTPTVELLSDQISVESILPETLEVTIQIAPTPTRTPRPVP